MGMIDREEKLETTPGSEPVPDKSALEAGRGPTGEVSASPRGLVRIALTAGVVAGLISWLAGELAYGTFAPSSELLHSANFARSPELARQRIVSEINNATLAFGILGSVLGMVMGAAGGLARRSLRAGAVAAAVGLVVGAAVGVGFATLVVPIAARDQVRISESLVFAFLTHGGVWAPLGAVGGLALGLGLGGRGTLLRAIVGGFVGAALGTIIYDLAGALAFPMAGTSSPLSTSVITRFLANLLVTLPAALGAALALESQAPPAGSKPAASPL